MKSNFLLKNGKFSQYSGFTLIELVIVMIMIGILSVTVIPKIFTSSGYEEIGYQAETVDKLRAIQLRAMQDTSAIQCLLVYVTKKKLGIPDSNCSPPIFLSNTEPSSTIVKISEQSLSFDDHNGGYSFTFDQMGRPDQARTINIQGGEQTLIITINAEGYISAN
ncbi:type II secretion system protein [Colwellia sp. BRX8-7]|jgi:MSHA pilin protein MshC|uniref:type II secretion system protein n=1 Tax=Colwellia sp. BRX8-7 TaxID=2759833 RepID=UPI0015F61831|nr:type II secretion system protein [Colwellia sp. BRX8-7]MBA6336740.1 type II secretion system protein [Colwellia sp. BRX8-7]